MIELQFVKSIWSNSTMQESRGQDGFCGRRWFLLVLEKWSTQKMSLRTSVNMFGRRAKGLGGGVWACALAIPCAYVAPLCWQKSQRSGYRACVWFGMINHIPFFRGDSSSWQQIWFWPLKSRHVVERRLRDLSFSMPLKENVWMGLLIRKQLEAIPHSHEISMHLLCKSQTDWRRC